LALNICPENGVFCDDYHMVDKTTSPPKEVFRHTIDPPGIAHRRADVSELRWFPDVWPLRL
ncbi:MAG: hypothetical protein ACRD72_24330, partial [Candidatus Angelobacter sp.]